MENSNMGGSLENSIFRKGRIAKKKQYIGGNCLKRWLGQFADGGGGGGGAAKKRGGVFSRGSFNISFHTMMACSF